MLQFSSNSPKKHLTKINFEKHSIKNYFEYFDGLHEIIQSKSHSNIPHQELRKHKIRILTKQQLIGKQNIVQSRSYVSYHSCQQNGLICTYQVLIGKFFLVIKMLNLQRNSEDQSECIGSGAFGIVKKVDLGVNKYAIKKIKFKKSLKAVFIPHLMDPWDNADSIQIEKAIRQYCIYKICSLYEIGPQIIFQNHYDLTCYNDCVEFYMELCEPIYKIPAKTYRQDLKVCVGTLHQLKFIHKDIKPANILFSQIRNKYLLCDFGITHAVSQNFDEATKTYFGGTPQYSSPELKKLLNSKVQGEVNLYYNDLYSLEVTLDEIDQMAYSLAKSYGKNSLSYMQQPESMSQSYEYGSYEQDSRIEERSSNVTPRQASSNQIAMDVSTCLSANLNLVKYSHEINYYQMKIIYDFLKSEQKTKQSLFKIIYNTIQKQNSQPLINFVQKTTEQMMFPEQSHEKQIRKFRNSVRVFGIVSLEVACLIQNILSAKNIPNIKYQAISNALNFIKNNQKQRKITQYQKIYQSLIQKSNFIENRGTQVKSVKSLIKYYLNLKIKTPQIINKIISNGIYLIVCQTLSFKQIQELYFNLMSLLPQISIEANQITEKIKRLTKDDEAYLLRKLQEKFFQIQEKQSHKDLKNFGLLYITIENQYSKNQYLQQIVKKILERIAQLEQLKEIGEEQQNILYLYYQYLLQFIYHGKFDDHELQEKIYLQLNQRLENNCVYVNDKFSAIKNPYTRISLIQSIIGYYFKKEKFNQAQQLNKICLKIKQQVYFPLTTGIPFAKSHFFIGYAKLYEKQYQQAIKSFHLCLKNISQNLRDTSYCQLITQTFNNLSYCYNQLGKIQQVINCLQIAYNLSTKKRYLLNEAYQVTYLQNLIFYSLKAKKDKKLIFCYLQQLCYLKSNVLKHFPFLEETKQMFIQCINLQRIQTDITDDQTFIFSLKSVVNALEIHLPLFLKQYLEICLNIFAFYNHRKQLSSGLKYLWKYFKYCKYPDQQIYHKFAILFIKGLIKSQSSRRALIFLRKYLKNISLQYEDINNEVYKQLCFINKDLQTKNQKYYTWIYKKKPYQNYQSYQLCRNQIENKQNLSPVHKYIWLKKLKTLKPIRQNHQTHFDQEQQKMDTQKKFVWIKKRKQNSCLKVQLKYIQTK